MLKTLKWVYRLGVDQERTRIARVLESELVASKTRFGIAHDVVFDDRSSVKKKMNADFEKEIEARIGDIIQNIFHEKGGYVKGSSIMFPDERRK